MPSPKSRSSSKSFPSVSPKSPKPRKSPKPKRSRRRSIRRSRSPVRKNFWTRDYRNPGEGISVPEMVESVLDELDFLR
jgi:hypothetical protein